jgi:hypothetical protein
MLPTENADDSTHGLRCCDAGRNKKLDNGGSIAPATEEAMMKDRQDGMTRRHYLAATGAVALSLGARGAPPSR